MITIRRSLLACLVLGSMLAGALATPVAAADLTVGQARQYLFDRINTARANHGLPAVQLDVRVQDIAQTRSDDMAINHYFGHLSNAQLAAMYNNRGIAWSKIGEILAANSYPALDTSADVAMNCWRNSSGHWSIITDRPYNFVGIGVARDNASGNWIWTVEFAAEPVSLTKPSVMFTNAQVMPFNASTRKVQVSWSGTAGTYQIKDYRLQYRVNNGAWHTVYSATTRTTLSLKVAHGKTIQFRARARDMRLNVGPWTVGPGIRS